MVVITGQIDTEWEVPKRCYNIYEKVKNFCGDISYCVHAMAR